MTFEAKRSKLSPPPKRLRRKAVRFPIVAEGKPAATYCVVTSSSTTVAVTEAAAAVAANTTNVAEKCNQQAAIEQRMTSLMECAKRLALQSATKEDYQGRCQLSPQENMLRQHISITSCCTNRQARSRLAAKTGGNQLPLKKWNIAQPLRAATRSMRNTKSLHKSPSGSKTSAATAAPAPPPSPCSPRSPRGPQLHLLIEMADNLLDEYKQTDQLTNTLLQDALYMNKQLFSYWQQRRDRDIMDQIELDYNHRVMETLVQSMRDEQQSEEQQQIKHRCAYIVQRHAQQTQTTFEEQMAKQRPEDALGVQQHMRVRQLLIPGMDMGTQTAEPVKRIENAISHLGKHLNMTNVSSADEFVAASSSPPPERTPDSSSPPASINSPSIASLSRSASRSSLRCCEELASPWMQRCQHASFRPIMDEYRERVQQIRKLMHLSSDDPDEIQVDESSEADIAQLRVQSQRNSIFYEMMHFAEDELLQLLPLCNSTTLNNHVANIVDHDSVEVLTENDALPSTFKFSAIVETGLVGDVDLVRKSVYAQSDYKCIGSEQHADGINIV